MLKDGMGVEVEQVIRLFDEIRYISVLCQEIIGFLGGDQRWDSYLVGDHCDHIDNASRI